MRASAVIIMVFLVASYITMIGALAFKGAELINNINHGFTHEDR